MGGIIALEIVTDSLQCTIYLFGAILRTLPLNVHNILKE